MFILLSEQLFVVLSLCKSIFKLLLSTAFPPSLARACFKELFQPRYIVLALQCINLPSVKAMLKIILYESGKTPPG